jgi:hypothetical protein
MEKELWRSGERCSKLELLGAAEVGRNVSGVFEPD